MNTISIMTTSFSLVLLLALSGCATTEKHTEQASDIKLTEHEENSIVSLTTFGTKEMLSSLTSATSDQIPYDMGWRHHLLADWNGLDLNGKVETLGWVEIGIRKPGEPWYMSVYSQEYPKQQFPDGLKINVSAKDFMHGIDIGIWELSVRLVDHVEHRGAYAVPLLINWDSRLPASPVALELFDTTGTPLPFISGSGFLEYKWTPDK